MSTLRLADLARKFLKDIDVKNEILLMTTFGLDERTLVSLLKNCKVNQDTRVVVYHEIMNHRYPGYIRNNYPNATTVAVRLKHVKHAQCTCPIFHSKLWLVYSKTHRGCTRLAVLSANITPFHFGEANATVETFASWQDLKIALPSKRLFTNKIIADVKRVSFVLPLDPETIVIDATDPKLLSVSREEKPAAVFIRNFIREQEESVLHLAAPFISKSAVTFLNCDKKVDIRKGERGTHAERLHAKVIAGKRHIIFGSANLTAQALGIKRSGAIPHEMPYNHETIVMARKDRFDFKQTFRGFEKIGIDELSSSEHDHCDPDADGKNDVNWPEKKDYAEAAPDRVILIFDQKKQKYFLKLRGVRHGASVLRLEASAQDNNPPLSYSIRLSGAKVVPNQEKLCALILHPPVTVRGMGKKKWKTELDYGELWSWVDRFSRMNIQAPSLSDYVGGSTSRKRKKKGIIFMDIRELRKRLFEIFKQEDTPSKQSHIISWFDKYHRETGFPEWCFELAHRLTAKDKNNE